MRLLLLTLLLAVSAGGPVGGAVAAQGPARAPADRPAPRTDPNSRIAHQQLLGKAKLGRIDVYFAGDSITRRWGATDYPEFLEHWKKSFFGWNAANFAWGGDSTQNILWRLLDGELDGVHPRVIVLQAGTNNIGHRVGAGEVRAQAEEIARGLAAILKVMREKAPGATIVLVGIFPRNDNMAALPVIDGVNRKLAEMADGSRVRFLDINRKLADENGVLYEGMTAPDRLHLALKGYQVWADALRPILQEILGPPAAEDFAPPPTGDPSAGR